jgi:hypothetical protein
MPAPPKPAADLGATGAMSAPNPPAGAMPAPPGIQHSAGRGLATAAFESTADKPARLNVGLTGVLAAAAPTPPAAAPAPPAAAPAASAPAKSSPVALIVIVAAVALAILLFVLLRR